MWGIGWADRIAQHFCENRRGWQRERESHDFVLNTEEKQRKRLAERVGVFEAQRSRRQRLNVFQFLSAFASVCLRLPIFPPRCHSTCHSNTTRSEDVLPSLLITAALERSRWRGGRYGGLPSGPVTTALSPVWRASWSSSSDSRRARSTCAVSWKAPSLTPRDRPPRSTPSSAPRARARSADVRAALHTRRGDHDPGSAPWRNRPCHSR
jgi:hypothetical protein